MDSAGQELSGQRPLHRRGRRLVRRLFRGSPEMLVTHLMNDHKVSAEELRRLKALVNARLEEDE